MYMYKCVVNNLCIVAVKGLFINDVIFLGGLVKKCLILHTVMTKSLNNGGWWGVRPFKKEKMTSFMSKPKLWLAMYVLHKVNYKLFQF